MCLLPRDLSSFQYPHGPEPRRRQTRRSRKVTGILRLIGLNRQSPSDVRPGERRFGRWSPTDHVGMHPAIHSLTWPTSTNICLTSKALMPPAWRKFTEGSYVENTRTGPMLLHDEAGQSSFPSCRPGKGRRTPIPHSGGRLPEPPVARDRPDPQTLGRGPEGFRPRATHALQSCSEARTVNARLRTIVAFSKAFHALWIKRRQPYEVRFGKRSPDRRD